MHKLLERQLKKLYGLAEAAPIALKDLLAVVDESYEQADADRVLLERSLDLTSQELLEANAELRQERTDLEERVAERTESIRKSEARYRDLFEGSRDVIYIASLEGRLLDINPAGVELFGFDSKEEMLKEVDLNRAYAGRQNLLTRLEKTSFLRDEELQLQRRDGKQLTVLATISARRDEWGRIVSMLGIVRDVTRQRVLERQLREAQKMEAIGRLAGGVAHDFNNLLTAIIGYSDLIRQSLSDQDPVTRQLEEIGKAGRRGAEMTRQLLAFSRRQVLKPTTLQLNSVLGNLERLLRRLIGEDIELKAELGTDLTSVRADPGQIEQVVMNLVINARDAMPEGGQLRLETRPITIVPGQTDGPPGLDPGSYVLMEVSDTGVGMDERTREQIFDPFFTTKDAGGTGLGLSTVYGIVRQSGGRIVVRSVVGRGTTFCIYLPSVDEPPDPEPAPRPARELPPGRETVLLVEDEPVVLTLVDEFLSRQGYTVLKATNAHQAVKLAERHTGTIDLLLSDVVMPGVNGVDLCKRLMREEPGLKVLLMSGYTGKRIATEAAAANLDRSHFLEKPFTVEQLGSKIREVLESQKRPPLYSSDSV